jgi:sec-independent protein translocase protein TatA
LSALVVACDRSIVGLEGDQRVELSMHLLTYLFESSESSARLVRKLGKAVGAEDEQRDQADYEQVGWRQKTLEHGGKASGALPRIRAVTCQPLTEERDAVVLGEILGWEILVPIALIALLFGSSQIPKLARSLGQASSEFRKGSEAHDETGASERRDST